jgi:hypothetical protein
MQGRILLRYPQVSLTSCITTWHLLHQFTRFASMLKLTYRSLSTSVISYPLVRTFSAMSWMDSWSRPNKSSAVPPPYYITQGESVLYCHACGRVITPRKSHTRTGNIVKYCSDRCRTRKVSALDRRVESIIRSLLEGEEGSGIEKTNTKRKQKKGDHRILVTCEEIEFAVFGHESDPYKTFGRKKNRYSRAIGDPDEEWKGDDMAATIETLNQNFHEEFVPLATDPGHAQRDTDIICCMPVHNGGAKVRPPQTEAEMNFAAMGGERSKAEKIVESEADLQKRIEGQKRVDERELVRKAARRAIVFGLLFEEEEKVENIHSKRRPGTKLNSSETEKTAPLRRKCEAVMNGQVVEPSFAKGNWAIRWRE